MIVCVRRANENAGNLISVVQFLIKVGVDDKNTGIFHVFELRIGMNEFDHRSFFSIAAIKKKKKKCDDQIYSFLSAVQIHGKFLYCHHLPPHLQVYN